MILPDGPGLRASVIVVSRHRPAALARCLRALARQSHALELVLVADPASLATCPDLPVKRVEFDRANIAQARNLGLAQAAGEIVLFIDDDALAPREWVARLLAAFEDPQVLAATGFTRGPDGLNWQARAERITPSGRSYPVAVHGPSVLAACGGDAVSTLGTNCAFRRQALVAIGGFDPAFAYHLDESDVNMRMAAAFPQGLTAVIPAAEVIHGLAAGTARARDGVPHDLRAIGRSTAIFAARHGGDVTWLRAAQRKRLLRLMVAGRLDPWAVSRIMATLETGLAEGAAESPGHPQMPPSLPPSPPPDFPPPDFLPPDFLPLARRASGPLFLSGWHWQARRLRRRAADAVAQGQSVRLLLLTPSVLPHRLRLSAGGWWEQLGGLWGPSQPGDSALVFGGKTQRIEREWSFSAASRY